MIWFWAGVNGWQQGFLREAYLGCCFGVLWLLIGLLLAWAGWITKGRGGRGLRNGNRVGDKVPGGGTAAPTVAARRSLAGIELQPTVSKSESMERERERGGRGGSVLGTPGMSEGVEGGRPRAAMIVAMAARGELGYDWRANGLEKKKRLAWFESATGKIIGWRLDAQRRLDGKGVWAQKINFCNRFWKWFFLASEFG